MNKIKNILSFIQKAYFKINLLGFKRTKEFAQNKLFFNFNFYLTKIRAKKRLSKKLSLNHTFDEVCKSLGLEKNNNTAKLIKANTSRSSPGFAKATPGRPSVSPACRSFNVGVRDRGLCLTELRYNKNFNNFTKYFLENLINDYNFDKKYILLRADKVLEDYIYFGQETINFNSSNFIKRESWHHDLNGFKFDPEIFYKDIKVKVNTKQDIGPDIRTLWEFNRFQNIFFLGLAQSIDTPVFAKATLGTPDVAKAMTGRRDERDQEFENLFLKDKNVYVQKFFQDINDWIDKNPYLYGPNWLCPMEVGIRSVNWVLGFMFFYDSKLNFSSENLEKEQELKFFKKFISSLYDHMIFIERNWEIYDTRTNNHYLSDLLGYYYLLSFFDILGAKDLNNKISWVKKEFLKELDKQILPDGSSYEGSTAYHVLVTEIVYYFKILDKDITKFTKINKSRSSRVPECNEGVSRDQGFCITNNQDNYFNKILDQKFEQLCNFASYFYLDSGGFITIGDNDSGKIVAGLPKRFLTKTKATTQGPAVIKHLNFGISVFKSQNIYLTLRQHAYNSLQPSAHFHNDILSLTLSISGFPVFIDPGSYVYTASSYWRNYFRSAQAHNGFCIEGIEPVLLDNNLFCLEIPENKIAKLIETNTPNFNNIFISSHELYKNLGLKATRKVNFENLDMSGNSNKIIVTDSWQKMGQESFSSLKSCWNLTLHPEIKAIKQDNNSWDLLNNNIKLANISSADLDFELIPGWASFDYGKKVETKRLIAKTSLKTKAYTWKININ